MGERGKMQLVRISKRDDVTRAKANMIRFIAVLAALLASALLILFMKRNPIEVYASLLKGAFGTPSKVRGTIVEAIPMIITSLGIAVAFKMKFWNIGAEGQIIMGAFAASYFGLNFPDMPMPLLLLIMAVAGIIGGGLWALIPGFFKAYIGANETLFTLMLNYIAYKWVAYLQYGPWKDPDAKGFPLIKKFSRNGIIPEVLGVHAGWIVAVILVVIMYIFMRYTKKGYEISVIGESENTARYAGMNVKWVILSSVFISGALCGLAGMIQVSGVNQRLTLEVAGGIGYTSIITTWLGRLSAPAIAIVSVLFAALVQGGQYIQAAFQIPKSAAQILQGMILFFVLGSEFFIQYKIYFTNTIKNKKKGDM